MRCSATTWVSARSRRAGRRCSPTRYRSRRCGAVEHTEIAGRPANVRIVSWAAAGLRLTQIAFLFVDNEIGYAVVGTCTDDRFAELEPTFRSVAAGFQLAQEAIR